MPDPISHAEMIAAAPLSESIGTLRKILALVDELAWKANVGRKSREIIAAHFAAALQSEREAAAAEARRAALATIFDGLEGAFTDESCVLIDEYIKDCEEEIDKADREFRSGDGIFWWTLTQLLRNARRLLASPTPQEARQTKDAEIALLKEQRDRARRQRIEADAEIARLRNALRKIESDTIDHVAVALARKALAALDTPSSPSLPESP